MIAGETPLKAGRSWPGLLAITLLALVLRAHHLGGTRDDPDEIMLPVFVLDSLPRAGWLESFTTFARAGVGNPGRLLAYPLSASVPLLVFAWVQLVDLLGLPLIEATWVLPSVVLGALTPLVAFALVRRLAGRPAGYLAAALLAVAPLHVLVSRSLAAAWVPAFLLEMLGILALERAVRGGLLQRLALSLTVALYVLTHNQFPSYAPLLLYATVVFMDDLGSGRARIASALRFLLRPSVSVLPGLAIVGLCAIHVYFGVLHPPGYRSTGPAGVGVIGHMLHRGTDPGFYGRWAGLEAVHALGAPLMALALGAGLLWILGVARDRRSGVLALWSATYLAPFVFLVSPQTTLIRGYMGDGLYASLLLAAVVMARLLAAGGIRRRVAFGLVAVVVPWSALSAVATVLGTGGPLALPRFHGVVQVDTGLKAAGRWVRESTEASARVFGFRLDPRIVRYYTRRESLGQLRLGPLDPEGACFDRVAKDVEVVLLPVAAEAAGTFTARDGFGRAATVVRADGRPLLSILTRHAPRAPEVITLAEANARFDREYARLARLGPLPDYQSCRDFRELW